MKRKIFASAEIGLQAKASSNGMVQVYSFFPVDRANCPCQAVGLEWKRKLAKANESERSQLLSETPFLTCPRNKEGMQKYKVTCNNCGDILGDCWAVDATLQDWCDFHYIQWTKGDFWHGCFTPHISPVTEQLCFECCCGQDTRDFRANMTMNEKRAIRIEDKNSVGRNLGKDDSKFLATIVKNVVT